MHILSTNTPIINDTSLQTSKIS